MEERRIQSSCKTRSQNVKEVIDDESNRQITSGSIERTERFEKRPQEIELLSK